MEELTYVTYPKKPKKKKKPPTPQQLKEKLRKKCVAKAKVISKNKQGRKCQYCGVSADIKVCHSHHLFHEGINISMSADVDNLITLCSRHHATGLWNHTRDFNFHASPAEAMQWFRDNNEELYRTLLARSRKTVVCDMQYWENKLKELNEL